MSAAWLLSQRHRITVYEREDRVGGHSHTVDVPSAIGTIPVDTGFIVYNDRNYPNLTALFQHLGVPTKPSEMSFAASLDNGELEYAGTDLNGVIGQRRNIVRPRFWRMMADIRRFYREAPRFLTDARREDITLDSYLRTRGYSDAFINDHLLPMGAAIWSTTGSEMRSYPAAEFIRFFDSHGLLSLWNRPQWRTVDGGSREYVKRLTAPYRARIRFGGARVVHRTADGVLVTDHEGATECYDDVVIATHADEALALLGDADASERRLLGAWRYTTNRVVLHGDPGLMPRRRRVWSSWNYIANRAGDNDRSACVTYWMNRLQSLDPAKPLFVTVNPIREPAPGTKIREFVYEHPLFDSDAIATRSTLWALRGHRRTWFCGSYFGYGFHEDALRSGLAVAEELGNIRRPWKAANHDAGIAVRRRQPAMT
jgi:uncharacterized protein